MLAKKYDRINNYNKTHYDKIQFFAPLGTADYLKKMSKLHKTSFQKFMLNIIFDYIEKDFNNIADYLVHDLNNEIAQLNKN